MLIHGVPYLALVWRYGRTRHAPSVADPGRGATLLTRIFRRRLWLVYLTPLVLVAWTEEWLWDRLVWHEHGALFPGAAYELSPWVLSLVVPLLTVPQATHYVLDAFVWKVRGDQNPVFAKTIDSDAASG